MIVEAKPEPVPICHLFSYLVLLNETRNGALGRMMSFTSIRTLTSKYGISSKMFIYGFIELQRWNLIERYVNFDLSHPKTNDYVFNDFYSMEEFRAKFDALKAKTPPELFDAAYKAAVELNEPYDLEVLGKFIDACKQYGVAQFQAAARHITDKSPQSPYRTPSFLLTMLRKGLKD